MQRQAQLRVDANDNPAGPAKVKLPTRFLLPLTDMRSKLGVNWVYYQDFIKNVVTAGRKGHDVSAWFEQAANLMKGRPDLEINHAGILFLLSEIGIKQSQGNMNINHTALAFHPGLTTNSTPAVLAEMSSKVDDENNAKPLGVKPFHADNIVKGLEDGKVANSEQNADGMRAGGNRAPQEFHSPNVHTAPRNELNALLQPFTPTAHVVGDPPLSLVYGSQMPVAPSKPAVVPAKPDVYNPQLQKAFLDNSATKQIGGSTVQQSASIQGHVPQPQPVLLHTALEPKAHTISGPVLQKEPTPESPGKQQHTEAFRVQVNEPTPAPTPRELSMPPPPLPKNRYAQAARKYSGLFPTAKTPAQPLPNPYAEAARKYSGLRPTAKSPPPQTGYFGEICPVSKSLDISDPIDHAKSQSSRAPTHHRSLSHSHQPIYGMNQGSPNVAFYNHDMSNEMNSSPFIPGAKNPMMFTDRYFRNEVQEFFGVSQQDDLANGRNGKQSRARQDRIPYSAEQDDLAVFRQRCERDGLE